MSSPDNMVYINQDFSEPMSAQYNFANQFDLSSPEQARMSYQRIMHEHTKHQFEMATSSANRRRTTSMDHHMSGIRPESSNNSVSSTSS